MVAFIRQLAPNSGTNGAFRAWGSQLSNDLAAMGLVKTNDFNQINWSTINAPTTNYQAVGYEVWRFNDALQAEAPVFFNLNYGSGTQNANSPGLVIYPGIGSNGLGIILGCPGPEALYSWDSDSANQICVFSGDINRVAIGLFTSRYRCAGFFSIERTKNNAGLDTNEGILFSIWGCNDYVYQYRKTRCISFSGASSRENESGILTPSGGGGTSGETGNDIALYPNYIFKHGKPLNPGITVLGYYNGDVLQGTVASVPIYGSMKKYYFLGGTDFIAPSARGGVSSTCLAMLFE